MTIPYVCHFSKVATAVNKNTGNGNHLAFRGRQRSHFLRFLLQLCFVEVLVCKAVGVYLLCPLSKQLKPFDRWLLKRVIKYMSAIKDSASTLSLTNSTAGEIIVWEMWTVPMVSGDSDLSYGPRWRWRSTPTLPAGPFRPPSCP